MRISTRLVIVELDDRDVSNEWVIGGRIWGQGYKTFYGRYLQFTNWHNKLECLSLANLYSLGLCSPAMLEPARGMQISGFPLLGRLLSLPTNIRLGWKGYQDETL
jgi:hypothetical protein